ncbi:unnamed protein product [Discosporangium mesarthrocarpum]
MSERRRAMILVGALHATRAFISAPSLARITYRRPLSMTPRMSGALPTASDPPSDLLGRGKEVFSLAPMMDFTDRHMRFFLRLLTKRTVLWTEMVASNTLVHNEDNLDRFLAYNDDVEHPVVLQVCLFRTCNPVQEEDQQPSVCIFASERIKYGNKGHENRA